LPIDFSSQSDHYFAYAKSLAASFNAELLILHVFGKPKLPVDINAKILTQSDVVERLENFVNTIEPNGTDIKIRYLAEVGFASEVILKSAISQEADLIVMGTRGTSNIVTRYFGSVSMTVMNNSKYPVLLVPPNVQFKGWNHLGCTIDFQYHDLILLNTLFKWSEKFNSEITCLHVLENEDFNDVKIKLNLLQELFADKRIEFEIKRGEVEKSIELFEKEEDLSLLGMVHQSKSLIGHFLNSDITEAIAEDLKVPLLVYTFKD